MSHASIIVVDSVTTLDGNHRDAVLVAGSHGGVIAAYLAAKAGARAAILNDAGVGLDGAGIAGLPYLAAIGMAAATVGHMSARIGDGADALARGIISHANEIAVRIGVHPGQKCAEAAARLRAGPRPHAPPPAYAEARFVLRAHADGPQVWGLDSVGKVLPEDRGRILVIGSHGGLHGGRPETALPVEARAAVFNDAGGGADDAGLTRLPVLDARGMPAATVACMSARIGDARSMWETGILSHVNEAARTLGARPGQAVQEFVRLVARSASPPDAGAAS
ncbi:MAG TPA: hypothetical protein VF342_16615 [Alphaproteobacteria bacterium]